MKTLKTAEFTLMEDRGWLKIRANFCQNGVISGFIKPVARL